jgi:predicted lipoprotein with Yx(FWY)xxD motif
MTIARAQVAQQSAITGPWPAGRGRRVRRAALAGLAGVAAVMLAGCAGYAESTGGGHPAPGTSAVMTRHLAGLGTVLVNATGKTIYSPQQEAHGRILCTGSCLSFWLPVTVKSAGGLHAAGGVTGVLGTVHRRDDGLTQVTYNGRPLYTFRLDHAPGEAHGSNFSDSFGGASFTWQAVTAGGGVGAPARGTAPSSGAGYQGGGAGSY